MTPEQERRFKQQIKDAQFHLDAALAEYDREMPTFEELPATHVFHVRVRYKTIEGLIKNAVYALNRADERLSERESLLVTDSPANSGGMTDNG